VVRNIKVSNKSSLGCRKGVVLYLSVILKDPLGVSRNVVAGEIFLYEPIGVPNDLLGLLLVLLQVVNHLQQVGQVPLDGVVVHVGLQGVVELLHLQSLLLNQE